MERFAVFAILCDRSCVSALIRPVTWIPFHCWVKPGGRIIVSLFPELSRTDPGGSQASTRVSADGYSRRLTVQTSTRVSTDGYSRRLTVWHGSIKLLSVWQRSCQKILLHLLWLPRTVFGSGSLLSWSCCSGLVLSLFYYIPTFDQVFDAKYVFTHVCIHMHVKAHTHTYPLHFKYTFMHFPFTQAMIYINLDLVIEVQSLCYR